MIFKTKEAVTKHISVNSNFELSEIQPSYLQAVDEYIVPALSRAFYNELATAENPTEDQNKALEYLGRALAHYTHFLYSFVNSVQVGSQGIQETSGSSSQPVRQWVGYDYRKSLIRSGDVALDVMLEWLEENAEKFPTWKNSEAYTKGIDLFFIRADQMKEFCNVSGGRRTYLALRPYIRRAERNYIKPLLGDTLFDQLKLEIKTGEVSSENKKLIEEYIRPALAPLSLLKAIPELSLEMTDEGIKFKSYDNGINKRGMASNEDKSLMFQSLDTDGNAELKTLEGFLIKNVADYPAFEESNSWKSFQPIAGSFQDRYPDSKIIAI
jgi:hypothetical protein